MKITDRDAELIMLIFGLSKNLWEGQCPALEECKFTQGDIQHLSSRLINFRIRVNKRRSE